VKLKNEQRLGLQPAACQETPKIAHTEDGYSDLANFKEEQTTAPKETQRTDFFH
jgi:hypothetical protein